MGKQKWQPEQKLTVVLEGLKNQVPVTELCRKHGISQAQYYKWRDQFLSKAKEFFNHGGQSQETANLKNRIHELERIIGKLTVHIEILKKTEEMMSG